MAYYNLRTGKRVAPPASGCLPVALFGFVLMVTMVAAIIEALPVETLILLGVVVFIVVAFVGSVLKKAFAGDEGEPDDSAGKATAVSHNRISMDAYKLANVLKGKAPADVLERCDSLMHNSVLLETYIMQCETTDRISSHTANFLRESYKESIERAKNSGSQNSFSQTSQSGHSYSVTTQDLERVYHNVYKAVPNTQCVDRLCKLFGAENFRAKICGSTQFCKMIFAENPSKDLLDYIYRHNKSAAYMCCIEVLRKQQARKQ